MRVLVCGGRDYADRDAVFAALDGYSAEGLVDIVMQGGAAGADQWARQWCFQNHARCQTFLAEWHNHGPAAGPIRNTRMIAEGKPDLVLAFPGGRGTADLVRKAEAAGIPVRRVPTPETEG